MQKGDCYSVNIGMKLDGCSNTNVIPVLEDLQVNAFYYSKSLYLCHAERFMGLCEFYDEIHARLLKY